MPTILLYGAAGFSGRLIARLAGQLTKPGEAQADCEIILAGRDGNALNQMAADNGGMEYRVFGLDNPRVMHRELDGVDVVLNAAGPFIDTAEPLLRAALNANCHYVDINGELDVYRRLDDYAREAFKLRRTLVCGAAASGGAADVLLDLALRELMDRDPNRSKQLGPIRIIMEQVPEFSRGSTAAALRSLREQIVTVRKTTGQDPTSMTFWHEPAGKLERSFDFSDGIDADRQLKIASAANLVDTPAAYRTVLRHEMIAEAIESYAETGPIARFAYQFGAMLSPLLILPWTRNLIDAQVSLFPQGPDDRSMKTSHTILLQIEDLYREVCIDWRLSTPNVYLLSAQIALAVSASVARLGSGNPGWITPSDALGLGKSSGANPAHAAARRSGREERLQRSRAFAGCILTERR